jgi:hypothetical protein
MSKFGLIPGMHVSYVVYQNADDCPGKVAVRRWVRWRGMMYPDPALLCIVDTIPEARRRIRAAVGGVLTRHPRSPTDARAVKESWS